MRYALFGGKTRYRPIDIANTISVCAYAVWLPVVIHSVIFSPLNETRWRKASYEQRWLYLVLGIVNAAFWRRADVLSNSPLPHRTGLKNPSPKRHVMLCDVAVTFMEAQCNTILMETCWKHELSPGMPAVFQYFIKRHSVVLLQIGPNRNPWRYFPGQLHLLLKLFRIAVVIFLFK